MLVSDIKFLFTELCVVLKIKIASKFAFKTSLPLFPDLTLGHSVGCKL